jgi:hypothetical protein
VRWFFFLAAVGLLAGCYNLTLAPYPGDGGGQDTGTKAGTSDGAADLGVDAPYTAGVADVRRTNGEVGAADVSGAGGAAGTGGATAMGTGGAGGIDAPVATGAGGTAGASGVAGTTGTGGAAGSGGAVGFGGVVGTGGVVGIDAPVATGGTGAGGNSGVPDALGIQPDVPPGGMGGAVGTGGRAGTGGVVSTGGAVGTGGVAGAAAKDASGVSDSDADGSSVGASLRLVQSFAGPGQSPYGIAWDGSHIWVSASATLFEMDPQGNLVNSISVGPVQGIVWDGAAFWLYNWTIAHGTIANNSYTTIGSFKSPATVSGGGINDDLAWDGQNLWLANQYKVFQLSTAGTVLSGTFSFAQNVAGLDWDGAHFWITYSSNGMQNKTVFAALDTSGRVIKTFSSPVSDVEAISWGASDHLWGLSPDDPFATPRYYVYEIDASSAKASLPK